MYQGKYEKTASNRKHRSRRGILVISLVLLLGIVVGGTVAYILDATNPLANTFTPAKVEIDPDETITPNSKSDIRFENSGTVPVYIRATLTIYWKDIIDNETVIIAQPAGGTVVVGALNSEDWFKVGDIYYYKHPVAPGESTSVMLDTITVTVPDGSTATCHIDVHSEAIQANPKTVVQETWTDVAVDENGKLMQAQPAG